MNGVVDDHDRALLDVAISRDAEGPCEPVRVWIDTAFDGHLVFPRRLIEQLRLESLVETKAILADGSTVALETFLCHIDWFGARRPIQRVLHIDYSKKELSVE